MTEFTITSSKIHSINPGDTGFQIIDGFTTATRASVEIDGECPHSYAIIIAQALEQGWIRPVAHITEREKLFIGLTQ
jgi:hypothetical protein